jgi:Fe2+ transport system protein FeoA
MDKGVYLITKNDNYRLLEYGFVEGTFIKLEIILNGIYVFIVRNSKIGIRESDVKSLELQRIEC